MIMRERYGSLCTVSIFHNNRIQDLRNSCVTNLLEIRNNKREEYLIRKNIGISCSPRKKYDAMFGFLFKTKMVDVIVV